MNITLGNGKAVHATDSDGQSLCHAEASRSGGGATRCLRARQTAAEVTCKRCIKLIPAPAAPAPVSIPAGHIGCNECGRAVRNNIKAITQHAAECWGAAAHVYA